MLEANPVVTAVHTCPPCHCVLSTTHSYVQIKRKTKSVTSDVVGQRAVVVLGDRNATSVVDDRVWHIDALDPDPNCVPIWVDPWASCASTTW